MELSNYFSEIELPGYLDSESIMKFLGRYSELINDKAREIILSKKNVTAYFLVDVYRQLQENSKMESKLLPEQVVATVTIDVIEDNKKTFGNLNEIERLALKIISYLDITPKVLLEQLLVRSDDMRGLKTIETLLDRKVVYLSETPIFIPDQKNVEIVSIFDSFRDFIKEQMYELDNKMVIPNILLDVANCGDEVPFALISLIDKYDNLNDHQRNCMKQIILSKIDNDIVLWIASCLAIDDNEFLQCADYSLAKQSHTILANFGRAFWRMDCYDQSIKFMERALEIKPNRASYIHVLAHCYQEVGNFEKAIKMMKSAVDLNNNYFNCLAGIYADQGDYIEAIKILNRAIEKNGEKESYCYNLGGYYNQLDKPQEAILYYSKSIKLNPQKVNALICRGVVYNNLLKDYGNAFLDFYKAISLDPKDAWAHDCFGNVLYEFNEIGNARREYETAIKLRTGTITITAEQRLVELNEMITSYEEGYKHILSNSIEWDSSSINSISYGLIMAEEYDKAAKIIIIGLQKDSNHSYLHATQGLLCFRKGDLGRGVEYYRRAISLSSTDLDLKQKFHFEYGRTLRTLRKFEEAIGELHKALDIDSRYISHGRIEVEIEKAKRKDCLVYF